MKPLNVYSSLENTLLLIKTILPKLERKMTSLKGEGIRVIDKFNGENFNIWKFKLDMNLAFVELWDIVDESKEVPCSNFNSKVKRK